MNIDMIHAAALRLDGHARKTPLLSSPFLDEIAGRRILIKAECLQHTGSFKFRGAWSAVTGMAPKGGVLAYSSGNHAQGVAMAARKYGCPAVIVMPADAPETKLRNTRWLGGEVVTYDRASESREEIGERIATERDLTLIRPFDEPLVIAGQGTTGLEIAAQAKEMGIEEAEVLVCCGGGGLSAGIALALEADAPGMRMRTVEPAGFDDVARSLRTGARQTNNSQSGSICDAILTPAPGELTFPILHRLCGDGLIISDEEALQAIALAFLRLKIVIEPGGAAALAAALYRTDQLESDTVIVTASGGNIDPEMFKQSLNRLKH
ncbi:MAG: threonine/serine dehydratase [Pseudomonadota bacterium]